MLDAGVAASLGFPVGSLTASSKHQSLLFGVSRWVDLDTADGHVYRFGVALRALVTVTQVQGDGALTLPVVAAKGKLERALLLDSDLRVAEPKTLRYRLWHVAARVVRHARRTILRLQRSWPWAVELARAFARLRALPLRC